MSKIKIIFLDVDGVLNSQIMYENREDIISGKGKISKKCLDILNHIIEKTNAKIVLSSTWRSDEDIKEYFYSIGLKGEIIGKTPHMNFKGAVRGIEILEWLKDNREIIKCNYHEFNSYVILDDDSDMLLWQANNFYRVDAYCGITPNLAYRVINFLNSFN